jgi:hypothetical protein
LLSSQLGVDVSDDGLYFLTSDNGFSEIGCEIKVPNAHTLT